MYYSPSFESNECKFSKKAKALSLAIFTSFSLLKRSNIEVPILLISSAFYFKSFVFPNLDGNENSEPFLKNFKIFYKIETIIVNFFPKISII